MTRRWVSKFPCTRCAPHKQSFTNQGPVFKCDYQSRAVQWHMRVLWFSAWDGTEGQQERCWSDWVVDHRRSWRSRGVVFPVQEAVRLDLRHRTTRSRRGDASGRVDVKSYTLESSFFGILNVSWDACLRSALVGSSIRLSAPVTWSRQGSRSSKHDVSWGAWRPTMPLKSITAAQDRSCK